MATASSNPSGAATPRPKPSAFVSAPPQRVLFLCVRNAGRSQIAEALARMAAPAGTEVWSAGTQPTEVNPIALQVLKEVGIQVNAPRAKHLDDVPWREADTIVMVCGEEEIPWPPVEASVRRVHWPLPNPAAAPEGERVQAFREARDDIRWRISSLWPGGD